MRKRSVAVKTRQLTATHVTFIATQLLVAAAVAVPLGVFAAAMGMLATRGQSGQVRITYVMPAAP